MEWVVTTAKSIDDARDEALDRLGVAAEDAEFEIIEEPKVGLFGRTRGEARLRARVKPTPVRAKQERRRRSRAGKRQGDAADSTASKTSKASEGDRGADAAGPGAADRSADAQRPDGSAKRRRRSRDDQGGRNRAGAPNRPDDTTPKQTTEDQQEREMTQDDTTEVAPQEVGDAAIAFMDGLTRAFGADASSTLAIDGTELELSVTGSDLGLLVGSGGRTLTAIQDLARVASQRRLGDHETRLRIDIAGYRERRAEALTRFARDVAAQVRESGSARSMEPMSSADRKVIHDVLNEEDGVSSRSEGEDPNRRIVVVPAD